MWWAEPELLGTDHRRGGHNHNILVSENIVATVPARLAAWRRGHVPVRLAAG